MFQHIYLRLYNIELPILFYRNQPLPRIFILIGRWFFPFQTCYQSRTLPRTLTNCFVVCRDHETNLSRSSPQKYYHLRLLIYLYHALLLYSITRHISNQYLLEFLCRVLSYCSMSLYKYHHSNSNKFLNHASIRCKSLLNTFNWMQRYKYLHHRNSRLATNPNKYLQHYFRRYLSLLFFH